MFATSNKFVTIIGNGYNLGDNPGLQQNINSSTIGSIISSTAKIKVVKDIKFIGISFKNPVELQTSFGLVNMFFESCLFTSDFRYLPSYVFPNGLDKITTLHFKKNYFLANVQLSVIITPGIQCLLSDYIFENNIVIGTYSQLFNWQGDLSQSIIRNNVFLGSFIGFIYSYVANNIFASSIITNQSFYGFAYCVVRNNIFTDPSGTFNYVISATDNLFNIDMSTVFQSTQTDKDNYFQLSAGSPAIGAGVPNGSTPVDCGAFGGPNPYKLSGIPSIPAIYELQVPVIVNTGTNASIDVKARSNN